MDELKSDNNVTVVTFAQLGWELPKEVLDFLIKEIEDISKS